VIKTMPRRGPWPRLRKRAVLRTARNAVFVRKRESAR
jgi:hypothetical protein